MKRLVIDLEKCFHCRRCTASCSYNYHPDNRGVARLLERCSNFLICRRCEDSPCEKACPQQALEKQANGVLKRYLMRCTGCMTCTISCPFGCTFPEIVPYRTSGCDYCAGRLAQDELPLCVRTCPEQALAYAEVTDDPAADVYVLNDHLAMRVRVWNRELFKKVLMDTV